MALKPGATLGVLGGGQLGQMFAQAAGSMGYRVIVFNNEKECPAGLVADEVVEAPFDDPQAIKAFAERVDAITLEWENIPVKTVELLEDLKPVYPGSRALSIAQDRLKEKTFFVDSDVPTVDFFSVTNDEELAQAEASSIFPAVLKTSRLGYDGKGQVKVDSASELKAAWDAIKNVPAILEGWVNFEKEISVIAARNSAGEIKHFRTFENEHSNHILDITTTPASVTEDIETRAKAIATALLEKMEYVGVLCVELFVTPEGNLLANEIAPRPHNSGHLTIIGCETSQFAQQTRALCSLELGPPDLKSPTAMVNLLGDLWEKGEPNIEGVEKMENVFLHLYGKTEARPGRKMGHITAVGLTPSEAKELAVKAREVFSNA